MMSDSADGDGRFTVAQGKRIKKAIADLRANGYAVVIFNPDELAGCPADDLESNLVMLAWEEMDHIKQSLRESAAEGSGE
jgi:hypothetical protein